MVSPLRKNLPFDPSERSSRPDQSGAPDPCWARWAPSRLGIWSTVWNNEGNNNLSNNELKTPPPGRAKQVELRAEKHTERRGVYTPHESIIGRQAQLRVFLHATSLASTELLKKAWGKLHSKMASVSSVQSWARGACASSCKVHYNCNWKSVIKCERWIMRRWINWDSRIGAVLYSIEHSGHPYMHWMTKWKKSSKYLFKAQQDHNWWSRETVGTHYPKSHPMAGPSPMNPIVWLLISSLSSDQSIFAIYGPLLRFLLKPYYIL